MTNVVKFDRIPMPEILYRATNILIVVDEEGIAYTNEELENLDEDVEAVGMSLCG